MSVKADILKVLEAGRGAYVSGQRLSDELGVTRAAVSKAVGQLRNEGYIIEAVTNKGYRMAADAGQVTAEDLRRALPAELRGMTIVAFERTDSTNIRARELPADTRLPALVFAGQQTAGRGRLGRSFHSPKNGIYMTLAINPRFNIERSTLVTVAAACATAKAIAELTDETPSIKWVNDIYIGDRKVCGILTEAVSDFETGRIEKLVIGIGINTNTDSFPATLNGIAGSVCLDTSQGEAHAKAALAGRITELLLSYLDELTRLDELSSPDRPSFIDTYKAMSNLIGKDIFVYKGTYRKDPAEELGGLAARVVGIDDCGGLQVEYEDGSAETLTTGEVSVRKR